MTGPITGTVMKIPPTNRPQSPPQIAPFLPQNLRRRPVDPKQRLFSSGSESKALFVARTGSFKTVAYSDDGQEQVLGFHLPGELIGLDALGVGYHRCDAIALEPAGVCEVPLNALEEVAAQVPGLQHQLLRIIGRSTGLAMDHMEMLGRRQAKARVLLFCIASPSGIAC